MYLQKVLRAVFCFTKFSLTYTSLYVHITVYNILKRELKKFNLKCSLNNFHHFISAKVFFTLNNG
jgi:hypothetical protein